MRNRPRLTRKQRRAAAAEAVVVEHPSNQAPAASVTPSERPGLVKRARAVLARRVVDKFGPAVVPPLVAGAVVLVTVGLVVGLCLGVVLSALARGEDWSA